MIGSQKITPAHLGRKAIVYLRQSSMAQVRHNKESQALQYALVSKAKDMGFHEVEVIDTDLGSSASSGAKPRTGFEQLLGAVALGQVGIVFSRELSRLSRTEKDWCHLLEVCQLFDTLVGDEDSVYDPSATDDQLILGIKGTLSVVELKVMRSRLIAGSQNKAKRGELYHLVPPGYVLSELGKAVKDPNTRIQESIGEIFLKFREVGSIRQTFMWFRDNAVELPVNKLRAGKHKVIFQRPTAAFVGSVLHNPFYAGAYVWGLRPMKTVLGAGGVIRKRQAGPCAPEKAKVFIREHHEGYINWETYQENLQIMRRNLLREPDASVGAKRAGQGLLTGLLRCGCCGRKLHVRYSGRKGTSPRYGCIGTYQDGGHYCLAFAGRTIDREFAEQVIASLSPLGVRSSVAARKQLDDQVDHCAGLVQREVEQLEYETARAFEQYDEVDPRNRLVASELEQRWNSKLAQRDEARDRLRKAQTRPPAVTEAQRARLETIGLRFRDVWHHPQCPQELKKSLIRALIEEAIVREEPKGKLEFIVRWRGGSHTSIVVDKPGGPGAGKNAPKDLAIIAKMAPSYGDGTIAMVLNRLERKTAKGNPWSSGRVTSARTRNGIAGRARTLERPEIVSLHGAAQHCGVSNTTITRLVQAKVLPMKQLVACAPWEIQRADLDAEPVRKILDHLKRTGKLRLNGGASDTQKELFQQNQGGSNDG
jgi:DNA invertase Pin-like site-specific DNA recombinase